VDLGIYGLLKAVHLTCFAGWSGLTLGGYVVLRSSPACSALRSYLRLVYLEVLSAAGLYASGLAMASIAGWPGWAYISSLIVLPVGFLEALHLLYALAASRTCYADKLFRLITLLTPLFAFYYLLMLYIMVFKPWA